MRCSCVFVGRQRKEERENTHTAKRSKKYFSYIGDNIIRQQRIRSSINYDYESISITDYEIQKNLSNASSVVRQQGQFQRIRRNHLVFV